MGRGWMGGRVVGWWVVGWWVLFRGHRLSGRSIYCRAGGGGAMGRNPLVSASALLGSAALHLTYGEPHHKR